MSTPNPVFGEPAELKRGRQMVLVLATVSLLVIGIIGALLVIDGLRHERKLQALAIAVFALMAALLCVRIARTRWLSLQVSSVASPSASEETGIWGVGGPGMRTPGATGIFTPIPGGRMDEGPNEAHRPEGRRPR
jgi:hypothetical protein